MKKKLLVILLPTILVVCAVVGIIIGVNSNPGGEVPHEHTYTDNVVSTTCTEAGYTEHKCSCGDSYRDNEVAAHHTLTFTAEKTSTCAETGNTAYYECSVCHKYFTDENGAKEITDKNSVKLDMLAHSVTLVPEKTATCAEAGNTAYYECSVCHKYFSDENGETEITDKSSVVTVVSHSLILVPEKEATCSEVGHTACYACTVCQKYFSDANAENEVSLESIIIDLAPHTVELVPEQESGLTTDGHTAYYECSECNKWFSDESAKREITDRQSVVIEAIHKLTLVPEKATTCKESGHDAYYTCAKCDKWFSDESAETEIIDKNSVTINALPHTVTLVPEKAATCTENGNIAYYECSECNSCFSDENCENIISSSSIIISADGVSHNWSTWQTVKNPTCTEKGQEKRVCGNNGDHVEERDTDMIPHAISFVAERTATCTENGNIAYYECSECNKYFSDENGQTEIAEKQSVIISILPHTVNLVPEKIATCTEKGNVAYYKCSECHKYFSDENCETEITDKNSVITTKPHNYVDGVCSVCGLKQPTEGLRYTKYNNEYAEVSGKGTATDKNIVIAEKYEGLPVTGIGEYAFSGYTGLTNITIPDSVTSIGDSAFKGCTGLTSITIPDSVTSIGKNAFSGCSGLTSVTIGNGVTSIGSSVFYGCTGLTNITIPDSVTSIGSSAFYNCSGLTSITIPDSITSIGTAFSNCSKLTSVYYKGTIEQWVQIDFAPSLLGDCSNPLYFAKNLYIDNQLLAEANISTATEIKNFAFYCYKGLTSVTIGNGVTRIGEEAFYNCSKLTNVTLGNIVTTIGRSAFYNCTGLTSITIPNSVISIGDSAFGSCTGLTEVTIPNSDIATSIGDSAFYNCTGLTSITIPNSVISIGSGAFSRCTSLTSITLPFVGAKTGVKSTDYNQYPFGYIFGKNSYSGGVATKQYYYGSSLTNPITYDTYYIPANLKTVTITTGEVLYGAFYNCYKLTSITISNFATSIGNYAFYYCSGLTSITIPNRVTSIGVQAFYNCSKLTSITIPDSVTSIGNGALYNCKGLTSITIGDSVASIGEEAFYGCSELTSVTIPDSVTSIGYGAFRNCTGLANVYYKGTETEWNAITIGSSNDNLTNANRYYYSETEPAVNSDGTAYDGNYWHYDANGEIVVWKKQ